MYTPPELQRWGTALLEALDEDGPEPDDGPPLLVNELRLTRFATQPGGRLVGRYDDAALFEAIAAWIDPDQTPRRRPRAWDLARARGGRTPDAWIDGVVSVSGR